MLRTDTYYRAKGVWDARSPDDDFDGRAGADVADLSRMLVSSGRLTVREAELLQDDVGSLVAAAGRIVRLADGEILSKDNIVHSALRRAADLMYTNQFYMYGGLAMDWLRRIDDQISHHGYSHFGLERIRGLVRPLSPESILQ